VVEARFGLDVVLAQLEAAYRGAPGERVA